ncbi:hypothetical protein H0H87_004367 [Tephrocybe sp. NHM501043]|nr:hypothetical protein H0H87_004367 [Tephrocybe sp. NHM501043]
MATNSIPPIHDPSKLFFQVEYVRRSIIAAYWAIIILALPLWWRTTSIERLALPSSRVVEQARHSLRIPIRIGLQTGSDRAQLQKSLDTIMKWEPQRWEGLSVLIHETEMQRPDDRGSRSSQFWAKSALDGSYTVQNSEEISVYGRHLSFPTSSVSLLASLLGELIAPSISSHRVAQYSPRYRLSFTLLNEDAASGDSFIDWDVSDAVDSHIQPVLDQLKVLHNFTIESQVQLHAPLAFMPRSLNHGFGIDPEDLTVFVNSAEWTLCKVTFLMYVALRSPETQHQVLQITQSYTSWFLFHPQLDDPFISLTATVPFSSLATTLCRLTALAGEIALSTTFLLPQWGGIVILNPDGLAQGTKLASASLDPIFSAFSEHLLLLLGVPSLPTNIAKSSNRLTDWQIDALLRYRTLRNSQESQETLRSIVSLVDQIENMPVGQDVRDDVQGALVALEAMFEVSKASLVDTFRLSARAFTLSSRAFFSPGMLALLYFPAEHKYAVYTPMFASAVIPLVVAALKEFASWRRQRKGQMASKGKDLPVEQTR